MLFTAKALLSQSVVEKESAPSLPTVLLERINLFRLRALSAGSAALTALASVRARCLRGWGTVTTRFLGLSCPNSQPTAPAVIQGC